MLLTPSHARVPGSSDYVCYHTVFYIEFTIQDMSAILLETQSRSDYVCCHPKPTIGQIMSATTLNLYYVQIMSATEPPPPFFVLYG